MTTDLHQLSKLLTASCPLFADLDHQDVKALLDAGTTKSFAREEVLIEQGVIPNGLFIITEGLVGIYNKALLLAELGPYSALGEGFLIDAPATATITTHAAAESYFIPAAAFTEAAHRMPLLLLNLFKITKARLHVANDAQLEEARNREAALKKQVEAATSDLNQTLQELRETQKFRDQFLANMSHEIRTPMNAIVGLTNLLVKTRLDEQQMRYLQVIRKSGDNLLVIINDILDLAKIEAGKMELESHPFAVREVVGGLQTILEIKAKEKGIAFRTEVAQDVPEFLSGDETRLTQILMNLAGNAIKFTESGSVDISVRNKKETEGKAHLHFSVKDTGIGISEAQLERIFESFSQASSDTTRKFGGTGLGLNISRQLVEMHGGHLDVASTFGEGSDFFFDIEYETAASLATDESSEDFDPAQMEGRAILLVEDDPFNQMVAEDTLTDIFPGVKITLAEDGQAAVDAAMAQAFDIILMDIQLPIMDGYDATRAIRSKEGPNQQTPICALTANITESGTKTGMAAGMNDYLLKPFDPDKLRERIMHHVLG